MIRILAKNTALAAAVALTVSASAQQDLSNPQSGFDTYQADRNWSGEVKRTERGHLIGKPDADATMIEFVSYTCGHCATFAKEGDPAIDLSLLVPGEMNLEVRPVIRNALDLTASLLVQCGDPKNFKALHREFMWSQNVWLQKAVSAPQSQQAIWLRGDASGRVSAAAALDLDDKLVAKGLSRTEINTCLRDDKAAQKLLDNGRADATEFKVTGTPTFALDGKRLEGVHNWSALYPVLAERFKPEPEANESFFGDQ